MPLQTRVTGILTKPADEWPLIAAETIEPAALMRDYAAPLAAIPAVCRWIGLSIVGISLPFLGTYRIGTVRGAANAIVSWVFALVGAWLAAMVVEKLAPTFQSRGSFVQALKLVVYAMTPVWIAGVLNLIPALAVLGILAALDSVYIFYLGLPVMMATPPDKVVPYMVVSALVIIVLSVVLGLVAAAFSGVSGYGVI